MKNPSFPILLHPSLQELKLSCVNIKDLVFDLAQIVVGGQSGLKKLILEECNITQLGLSALLRLPKALEELYLGT